MSKLLDLFYTCNKTFTTDSRKITPGCMFFALEGENFDGHDFVSQVLQQGARYTIVHKPEFVINKNCILVDDTLGTLQDLAKQYRNTFDIPIIAIGGSNGKTTTKELVSAVLSKDFKTHTTVGNLNNHIGVPLTILSMPPETELFICEIGANHQHEHELLLDILKPTHVLITNNGKDHLEGFGSIEGVRRANGEIYEYAKNNPDIYSFTCDTELDLIQNAPKENNISYGYNTNSQYVFTSIPGLYAGVNYYGYSIISKLIGTYNEKNIMAAVGLGLFFNVSIEKIIESTQNYTPSLMRSEIRIVGEKQWIMDCYNANPSSMMESLKHYFSQYPVEGVIILGDMAELGEHSETEHGNILKYLSQNNFTICICIGKNFLQHQPHYPNILFFENHDICREYFIDNQFPTVQNPIFLKGSRSMKMETCTEYL
jgi:UDP-N-acetylmuramoyl-tripeptide--D-alanyl-D-alanine ligase